LWLRQSAPFFRSFEELNTFPALNLNKLDNLRKSFRLKTRKIHNLLLKGLGHEIEFNINVLGVNRNLHWFLKFSKAPKMRCRHCRFPRGKMKERYLLNFLANFVVSYWPTGWTLDSYWPLAPIWFSKLLYIYSSAA